MDTNLLKVFTDLGTIGILLYLILNILSAYVAAANRTTDLLEDLLEDKKAE